MNKCTRVSERLWMQMLFCISVHPCHLRIPRPVLIWGVFAFCAILTQTHPNQRRRNNRQSRAGTLPCFPPEGGFRVRSSCVVAGYEVIARVDLPMAVVQPILSAIIALLYL